VCVCVGWGGGGSKPITPPKKTCFHFDANHTPARSHASLPARCFSSAPRRDDVRSAFRNINTRRRVPSKTIFLFFSRYWHDDSHADALENNAYAPRTSVTLGWVAAMREQMFSLPPPSPRTRARAICDESAGATRSRPSHLQDKHRVNTSPFIVEPTPAGRCINHQLKTAQGWFLTPPPPPNENCKKRRSPPKKHWELKKPFGGAVMGTRGLCVGGGGFWIFFYRSTFEQSAGSYSIAAASRDD